MSRLSKRWQPILLVLVIAVVALTAVQCATPAPQVVEKVVTQVVEKQVVQTQVVEKAVPQIQTQVVEKLVEKQVTVAPAACATKKDKYKIGFANLIEDIVFTQ